MPEAQTTFRCPACRYDLAAQAGMVEGGVHGETELACPECGARCTGLAASSVGAENRGWVYFLLWIAAVSLVVFFIGCGLSAVVFLVVAGRGGP